MDINNVAQVKTHVFRFEDFIQDGVMNYKFRITKGEVSYNYMIRPQIDLGPANRVAMQTRPDFMISLTSAVRNGLEEELTDSMGSMKSVAVYLDGYTCHATESNFRFYDDLSKRRAILASGSIISWTLTWADMERFDIAKKDADSSRR
jgi:DEAD/DEAH box helicase domain-containing protein